MSVDLAAATAAGVIVVDRSAWADDGDAYTVQGVSRPVPTTAPNVTSLVPATIAHGAAPLTVLVKGTGFVHGDRVSFGGSTPPTSYHSDKELAVNVDPKQWQAGQVGVMVAYSSRGPSNSVPFTFT